MSRFRTGYFLFPAVSAVLALSSAAQAQSLQQQSLQQVADESALAAVQMLAVGGTSANAVATAQQVARVPVEVDVSPGSLEVTVKVSQADSKHAGSTARYIPPEQPTVFSWAARQKFAVKPQDVVVGSFCVRDCEPNRLR